MSAVMTPRVCRACDRGYVDATECDWCGRPTEPTRVVDLDMDQVARAALGLRSWRLEFDCHGAPYVWAGEAADQAAAEILARHQLALDQAGFHPAEARLTACVER